jgi:hypothetical protein
MLKTTTPAILVAALALVGCGDNTATESDLPAGQPPVDRSQAPDTPGPGLGEDASPDVEPAGETHTAEGLVYTVPAGWSVGEPRQMRVLTLMPGDGVEIAVARWPGGVGTLESNLTRWLGQAGYNPADAAAMQQVRAGFETFTLGDAEATWMPLLDGTGSPMIGVWAPRGENPTPQSETWTLKITGDADALRENAEAIRAWAEALSFE